MGFNVGDIVRLQNFPDSEAAPVLVITKVVEGYLGHATDVFRVFTTYEDGDVPMVLLTTEDPSDGYWTCEVVGRYTPEPLTLKGADSSQEPQETPSEQIVRWEFEEAVDGVLEGLGNMLKTKNRSYGNAALDPMRVFSTASTVESLGVRIDDKISRMARGSEYPGDDTVQDLVGYLVLYLIAREEERRAAYE